MKKILVVDDDDSLRRLMRLELGDAYEIIDSGAPEEGLALALEHKPDAILLDLRMPKYSGYELCQTFATFSRTQMIPVIIVSGEAGGQNKEHCKQLGAVGYFEKPIDFDALRLCLSKTAKPLRHASRSDVLVGLPVSLMLRGEDVNHKAFQVAATTENVSLNGFVCRSSADLALGSIVEVYLVTTGEERVGKAKVIHAGTRDGAARLLGCQFTERTGPWVLS